jgi:hypothetical protein
MNNINRIRNKKAQIAGQIFIYIMAAIIIGAIVYMGAKAVTGVMGKTCDAEKISFKADIESLIEKYNSYGSVNSKTLRAPCGYDTVCFVSASDIPADGNAVFPLDCTQSILIKDSVDSGVRQNIFVISEKRTIPVGYSELISLDATNANKCLCIAQKNGNFKIRFTGRGTTTEISEFS